MGRIAAMVAVVLVAGSLWYGHAPPRSAGAYRREAAATVELLGSQVGTARLWMTAVTGGRVTRSAASVGFREAEDDARATAARFAAYDPPPATDLREQVTGASAETVEALAALRIAARTGRWDRLGELDRRLGRVEKRLTDLGLALR